MEVATQEDTCQIVLLCYSLPMSSTTWLQMYSYARQALHHRIWLLLLRPDCLAQAGSRRRMLYPDSPPQIDAFFPGASTTIFRRSTMPYNAGVTEA